MKIAIGAFARTGIESELESSLPDAVHAALCHYCGKVESGRPPLDPPGFLLGDDGSPEDDLVIDLIVDDEIESALAREARAHGLPLERLAGHTVLVYLAELDFIGATAAAA